MKVLAARMKTDPANLTRIVQGRPLSPKLLRAARRAFKDPVSRLAVFIAHVRDEALRAGCSDDFTVSWQEDAAEAEVSAAAHQLVKSREGPRITTRKPISMEQLEALAREEPSRA